jgi:hypothetical protein
MKAILKESGDLLIVGSGQAWTISPEHRAYGRLMRLYAGCTSLSNSEAPEGYGGHPWERGTPIPDEVYDVPVEAIEVDPERLQYKRGADGETGVVTPWEDFDPEQIGELSVWKHRGKTKLVDGHHRFQKAKECGMETVPCRYIQADNEAEARAIGKHINGYREAEPVSLSFSGDVVSEAVRALRERFPLEEYEDISLSEGKWITIGGHEEGEEKHVGGFRVQIDGDGKILKGRMQGKNVKDVKTAFDAQKAKEPSKKVVPQSEVEKKSPTSHKENDSHEGSPEDVLQKTIDYIHENAHISQGVDIKELREHIEKTTGPEAANDLDETLFKLWREGKVDINTNDEGNISGLVEVKDLPPQEPKEPEEGLEDYLQSEIPNLINADQSKTIGKTLTIPDLREHIKLAFGKEAASHAVLDNLLLKMHREGKIRLEVLSDLSRAKTKQQQEGGIKNGNNRLYWIEATPEKKEEKPATPVDTKPIGVDNKKVDINKPSSEKKKMNDAKIPSTGKRVFDMHLVKGSKPGDMVRLVHDDPFPGSSPIQYKDGPQIQHPRHSRVLSMKDAAAIINEDIKAGNGTAPLTKYVDKII